MLYAYLDRCAMAFGRRQPIRERKPAVRVQILRLYHVHVARPHDAGHRTRFFQRVAHQCQIGQRRIFAELRGSQFAQRLAHAFVRAVQPSARVVLQIAGQPYHVLASSLVGRFDICRQV
ncbi:hypothetical protein LPJ57_003911, partial [Coemansia sp. RSA 486]